MKLEGKLCPYQWWHDKNTSPKCTRDCAAFVEEVVDGEIKDYIMGQPVYEKMTKQRCLMMPGVKS
jgi:hypothetical protein